MESVRRCEDCRRIVRGSAGDACPYCGSGRLIYAQTPVPQSMRHASVLTLVLTLSVGLILFRIVLIAIGSPAYGELLFPLQFTAGIAAIFYLILRRSEGDFRALLMVSLGLFVATEVTGALAKEYGMLALSKLGRELNLTLFIFAGISMTAAVADGRRSDRFHSCLIAANMGFLFLSSIRTIFHIRTRDFDDRSSTIGTLVLSGIILYVAILLARSELRARSRTVQTPAAPVQPPPMAVKPPDVIADAPEAVEQK